MLPCFVPAEVSKGQFVPIGMNYRDWDSRHPEASLLMAGGVAWARRRR
jgi:hypothetical protein